MKPLTSLINIRFAVGATLAISAALAVVLSLTLSTNETASGAKHPNHEAVSNAVATLEVAVATPDKAIKDLLAATVSATDDSTLVEAVQTVEAVKVSTADDAASIVPKVSIANPDHDPSDNDSPATVTVAISAALGTSYLTARRNLVATARADESKHLTDEDDFASSYGGKAVAKGIADLKAATVQTGTSGNEVDYTLNAKSRAKLDAKLDELLDEDKDHNIATYIEEVKAILETTDETEGYFNTTGTTTTRVQLTIGATGDPVHTNVVNALNDLYTAGTGNNADTGSLVHLKSSRKAESDNITHIRNLFTAVETAIKAVPAPADTHKYSDIVGYNSLPGSDDAAKDAEAKKRVTAALTFAKGELTGVLDANEELTAFDELEALVTTLTTIGGAPSGVLKDRLEAIDTALLENNVDDLDESDPADGDSADKGEAIYNLRKHATDHIVDALMALKNLDGKSAQMTAIQDLVALLTLVDTAVTKSTFTDSVINADGTTTSLTADVSNEAAAVAGALTALKAVKTDLEAKHVDPADVDSAITALNTIANDDVSSDLGATINTAASNLSNAMNPDNAETTPLDESALFKALKASSILGSYLPAAAANNQGDAELTGNELSMALGLTRTEPDPATPNNANDGTLATSDFATTLDTLAKLEDLIDTVDTESGDGVQPSTALDALVTAMEATVVDTAPASTGGSIKAANTAAEAFRGSSLAYDAYSAMSALLDALDDVANASSADLDAAVQTAREALINAYNERRTGVVNNYDSDTVTKIETAYTELITKGSTSHRFAQQAALKVVKASLESPDADAKLDEKIQAALGTQSPSQQQAQAMISKIEAEIDSIVVSGGDKVKLSVDIYGLQDKQDQKLANGVTFAWSATGGDVGSDEDPSITYTAPSAPGSYDVTVSLDANECYHADAETQAENCSATITVKVRRPSPPQPQDEAPVNPATIPAILTDGSGNQYEVFTPVEGGTFNTGEGYWITAQSGDVPNGELIGVRMSDDGSASNLGMTHQRYTLGGNMYGIHVVDAAGSSISSYVLDDPAQVCVPLPAAMSSNISKVAIVAMNSDGTLTILSSSVKLGSSGTSVCGSISTLPASIAVGTSGAPDAIPTATPEPTPVPPPTGATAPASNGIVVWAILLGLALTGAGTTLAIARRRRTQS